jgi:hypothetical protein
MFQFRAAVRNIGQQIQAEAEAYLKDLPRA